MSPKVVLVGLPGSGKTTIGRRLGNALNVGVVDTDQRLEQRFNLPCGELLTEVGEPAFRAYEAEEVATALETSGVVSLGGGAVVTESTRRLLQTHRVVFLDVSVEEGVRRTSRPASVPNPRPLLAGDDPHAIFRALVEQRSGWYREVADLAVRCDGKEPQRVVAEILSFLEDVEAEERASND